MLIAIITGLSVILGSFISVATSMIGAKRERDAIREDHIREKREQAYFNYINTFIPYLIEPMSETNKTQLKKCLLSRVSEMSFYSSSNISDKMLGISNSLNKNENILKDVSNMIDEMKKELFIDK